MRVLHYICACVGLCVYECVHFLTPTSSLSEEFQQRPFFVFRSTHPQPPMEAAVAEAARPVRVKLTKTSFKSSRMDKRDLERCVQFSPKKLSQLNAGTYKKKRNVSKKIDGERAKEK